MHRIDGAGHVNNTWVAEDPATNRPPTEITPEIMNALQEEIANVVEGAGGVLDKVDNTQLLAAIKNLIEKYSNNHIAKYTTTANVALNGLAVQAGGDWAGALTSGDIIFVKDQDVGADNGWYVAAAGAWGRVSWADVADEIKPGVLTQISGGATLADSIWILTTDGTVTIGVTGLSFQAVGAVSDASQTKKGIIEIATAAEIAAADGTRAVTGAALIAGLLGAGGVGINDYVSFPFRDRTTGALRRLIVQLVAGAGTALAGVGGASIIATINLPIQFPNARVLAIASGTDVYGSGGDTAECSVWCSDSSTSTMSIAATRISGSYTSGQTVGFFGIAIGY